MDASQGRPQLKLMDEKDPGIEKVVCNGGGGTGGQGQMAGASRALILAGGGHSCKL